MESTIVFKKRELLVVEDFWKKALAARPTAFSFMTSNGKSLRCEYDESGDIDVKVVMDIQQEYLKREIFFWLMKADKYKPEDVQPIVCIGDDKEPVIVGMSDGEFKNFTPAASEHSNDYFLFNKYIIPKLNSLGKDRDAIFNNLANDLTSMEIKQMLGDIGTVVLLGDNGRNVTFSNHTQNEYEWGWASNGHGFTEEKKEKSGIVRRVLSSVSARPIADTKPIVQPPKTETATVLHTAEALEEWHEFTPPKGLSNKALKSIYKRVCNGTLPANWRDRPTVKYKKTIGVKPPAEAKEKPTVVKDFKDIPRDIATEVTTDPLPLLSPKVIESFEHEFMKDLDKQSTVIPSPEKILEDMKEMPDFWEQNAYDKKYTDAWLFEKFKELGKLDSKALAILCFNYRNLLLLSDNLPEEGEAEFKADATGTGVVAEGPEEPAWKKRMREKQAAKAM